MRGASQPPTLRRRKPVGHRGARSEGPGVIACVGLVDARVTTLHLRNRRGLRSFHQQICLAPPRPNRNVRPPEAETRQHGGRPRFRLPPGGRSTVGTDERRIRIPRPDPAGNAGGRPAPDRVPLRRAPSITARQKETGNLSRAAMQCHYGKQGRSQHQLACLDVRHTDLSAKCTCRVFIGDW